MDSDDPLEFLEERAAIMQFDAGINRADAEFRATICMRRWCFQKGMPEPRDHWSRSMPRVGWSDEQGGPDFRREPYRPPQLKG